MGGFPEADLPDDHFDVVVGSIAFGSRYSYNTKLKQGFGHIERCVIRALQVVRPGGIVAIVTSDKLLDDTESHTRKLLSEHADLLGAVRLPNHTHTRFSNSYSGEDVVLLRRRLPDAAPSGCAWEATKPTAIDGQIIPISEYFVERPQHVLGTLRLNVGTSPRWLEVRGDVSYVPGQLRQALAGITGTAALRPHEELWDTYRATICALGDARTERLLLAINDIRDTSELPLERRQGQAATALATLDLELARRAWDLDCALAAAKADGQQASERLAHHEATLARAVGRPDREAAEMHITTWTHLVQEHDRQASRVREEQAAISRYSRHPDAWWDPHALRLAAWVAQARSMLADRTSR